MSQPVNAGKWLKVGICGIGKLSFTFGTMPVSVKIELKNKKIDIRQFSEPEIRKASMRAINQATAQIKTLAVREITQVYKLSSADVRPQIFVLKASAANLTGKLLSSRSTIPMVAFKPVEIRQGVKTRFQGSRKSGSFIASKTRDKAVGVKIEIIRGETPTLKEAFLFFGSSVRPSVKAFGEYSGDGFSWNEGGQGKATKLNTLSIAGALRNDQIIRVLKEKAAALYEKTYYSQLRNIGKF